MTGRSEQRGAIIDISRGGKALRSDWSGDVGMEVMVKLPGIDRAVGARTVRSEHGVLALAFHQNAEVLRHVDAALAHIERLIKKAAA